MFPLARVKRIIKEDPDIGNIGNEGVSAISFAAEEFVQLLAKRANEYLLQSGRKSLAYKDIARIVKEDPVFEFLKDIIPDMIPLSEAMKIQREEEEAQKLAIAQERKEKKAAESIAVQQQSASHDKQPSIAAAFQRVAEALPPPPNSEAMITDQ